jgi:glucose/arabinose dehydrogenase
MNQRLLVIVLALACEGHALAGQDQALRVPPGFHVSVFARDVSGVRYLTLGPGGVVYASRPGAGVIVKLPDANRDGVADSAVTVATGLNRPFGIAFRGDTMFVAENTGVVHFNPGAANKIVDVPNVPGGTGHWTRTIVFGADGKMYVSVGSSCNLCIETDSMRAAVMQFNRDGTGGRVYARGLRNSVGLAFNPTTGELWATNNDRDYLGDDVPPERINIVKDGKYYGWPQCYLPGQRNPEYAGADCSTVEPPAITFQAHSAPLGIAFYTGTAFAPDYRGDAFVAYHGSWNRTVPTGAKVVRVQVQNGRPVAIDDFITGWQMPDGTRWGRPVGLVMTPDGALLVSDDMGGKIWRITYGR